MNLVGKIMIAGAMALLPLAAGATDTKATGAKAAAKPAKAKCLTASDTDCNGMISQKEWLARAQKNFAEIDANRDGNASREELKANRDKRRADRAGKRTDRAEARKAKAAAAPAPAEKK